jgi:hypothetical protein
MLVGEAAMESGRNKIVMHFHVPPPMRKISEIFSSKNSMDWIWAEHVAEHELSDCTKFPDLPGYLETAVDSPFEYSLCRHYRSIER